MTDKLLWERIQNNDNQALKEAFDLYYKVLCSYILQFTHDMDNAEDIVQNTFITLWTKRNNINIKSSLKSYLFRSAYNKFLDDIRTRKKEIEFLNNLKYEAINSILEEDTTIVEQKTEAIKNLVNTLPHKCKEILLLSKEKKLKNREIAKLLGVSIKTVESQIRIAYQKIKKGYKN